MTIRSVHWIGSQWCILIITLSTRNSAIHMIAAINWTRILVKTIIRTYCLLGLCRSVVKNIAMGSLTISVSITHLITSIFRWMIVTIVWRYGTAIYWLIQIIVLLLLMLRQNSRTQVSATHSHSSKPVHSVSKRYCTSSLIYIILKGVRILLWWLLEPWYIGIMINCGRLICLLLINASTYDLVISTLVTYNLCEIYV